LAKPWLSLRDDINSTFITDSFPLSALVKLWLNRCDDKNSTPIAIFALPFCSALARPWSSLRDAHQSFLNVILTLKKQHLTWNYFL